MSEETITIRRKEYEELSKNSEELQVLRKKNEELTLQIQFFWKKLTRHKSIALAPPARKTKSISAKKRYMPGWEPGFKIT